MVILIKLMHYSCHGLYGEIKIMYLLVFFRRLSSDTDIRNIVDQWKRNHETTESKGNLRNQYQYEKEKKSISDYL